MASDVTIYLEARHQPAVDGINKVTKATDRMTTAVKKSTLGTNQNGAAVSANTRGMSRWAKSGVQQAGYQIGDLAVQLDGGTSFLRAFGQQGSQLLGIFGPLGAVLGAGVAIVAAFGNAFFVNKDPVKSFSDEVDEVNSAINKFTKLAPVATRDILGVSHSYETASVAAQKLFNSQKMLAQFALQKQLTQVNEALKDQFDGFYKLQNLIDQAPSEYKFTEDLRFGMIAGQAVRLGKQIGQTATEAKQLALIFKEIEGIDPFKDPDDAADALQKALDIITATGLGGLDEEVVEASEAMAKLIQNLRVFSGESLVDAGDGVEILAQRITGLELAMMRVQEATKGIGQLFDLALSDSNKLAQGISVSMGNAFKSIVMGTGSVKDAFRTMALAIIDQLLQVLVIQRIVGMVGTTMTKGSGLAGFFSGTSGQYQGGFIGPLPQRAIGGSVQSGSTYLVGERGPELFMANSSGSIVPNNKMGGGDGVVVNQTINVSTGVAQTVRTEIATLMPQIAEASKAAVLDAKQRGGNFSRAF